MQIKVGATSNNALRIGILNGLIFGVFLPVGCYIRTVLDNSHDELVRSSMSNVTSMKNGFYCGISYDDCRCSVQSTKNIHLKYCLTDNFLMVSHIHPLVSFVVQIFHIRDLFTIIGKHTRLVAYSLWIISLFTFVIIANGICRNSCFYRFTSYFLHLTGGLLFLRLFYMLYHKDIHRSSQKDSDTSSYNNPETSSHNDIDTSSHNDIDTSSHNDSETSSHNDSDTSNDEALEEDDNEPIFWRDLL